ncbi:MAG: MBL fold metallo-hydrolase [Saprospiraceae bacterium]|nr:MBL fold metallo-hydrolase [Lewinella sp.]
MIQPYLKDDNLLTSIHQVDPNDPHFTLWWLGQSGFLIHWQGQYLLFDPYLSDSLTVKYADTDKPHIRMTELAIDPVRLDCVDVVTSTHNHTDHLDAYTLISLMGANPEMQLIIPEANRNFVVDRIGCDPDYPIGLNDGQSASVGHFTLHGVPAAHNDLERDEAGRCRFMGYVATFGPWTVYHSGDTLWYTGMEDVLSGFNIDLALLPINGNKPERRVAGNLNGEEAARLGRSINARMVIPCHYDMFTFNTADPTEFAHFAETQGQPYRVLQCGEPWQSDQID